MLVPVPLANLLTLRQSFEVGCDILASLSAKQQFADAVARERTLWRLLCILERPEATEDSEETESVTSSIDLQPASERMLRGWATLESLTSSPSIAHQLMTTSGWMELLGVLVGYDSFTKIWTARLGAAKSLSRLLWDPSTGPVSCT